MLVKRCLLVKHFSSTNKIKQDEKNTKILHDLNKILADRNSKVFRVITNVYCKWGSLIRKNTVINREIILQITVDNSILFLAKYEFMNRFF